jgi:hypothetical protein
VDAVIKDDGGIGIGNAGTRVGTTFVASGAVMIGVLDGICDDFCFFKVLVEFNHCKNILIKAAKRETGGQDVENDNKLEGQDIDIIKLPRRLPSCTEY